MKFFSTLILVAAISFPAWAGDKDKDEDKNKDGNFDDLFGDSLDSKDRKDDLKKATDEVESKKQSEQLSTKSKAAGKAGVKFDSYFAAKRIIFKKNLCVPGPPTKTRLTYIEYNIYPTAEETFSVCLTMSSKTAKTMRVTATLKGVRRSRIARSTATADFSQKESTQVVFDFKKVVFDKPGAYELVIDIDGKKAGKLPLFPVRSGRK